MSNSLGREKKLRQPFLRMDGSQSILTRFFSFFVLCVGNDVMSISCKFGLLIYLIACAGLLGGELNLGWAESKYRLSVKILRQPCTRDFLLPSFLTLFDSFFRA